MMPPRLPILWIGCSTGAGEVVDTGAGEVVDTGAGGVADTGAGVAAGTGAGAAGGNISRDANLLRRPVSAQQGSTPYRVMAPVAARYGTYRGLVERFDVVGR